jgi:Kef-type K+ transport system membrane component KefB
MQELISDITPCILFAWALGLLAHFSRQPLILAYLIAGFLLGPFGMGWVKLSATRGIFPTGCFPAPSRRQTRRGGGR